MKKLLYCILFVALAVLAYNYIVLGNKEREANIKYLDARQAILFENNYKKGVPLLKELSNMDYGLAVYDLGVLYEKGKGVENNKARALKLYKKAMPLLQKLSQNGDGMATGYIGEIYLYGRGVPKDSKRAKIIFQSIDQKAYQAYKNTMLKKIK